MLKHANPYAGLATPDDAAPDLAYLARARREVLAAAAIATLLAAPNAAVAVDDVYIDPRLCTAPWLNALADALGQTGGAL